MPGTTQTDNEKEQEFVQSVVGDGRGAVVKISTH